MSKQTKPTAIPSFIDYHWTDHPAVEWISNNKQTILWIIIGLFAVLILAYRVMMTRTLNAEGDYFRAQTDFNQFQEAALTAKNAVGDSAALNELDGFMASYPELHAKYDGPLAQTLIIEEQMPKALPLAQATFKRTANDSINLYQDYAASSLLIGEGKYQEALQQSKLLKDKLNQQPADTLDKTLYFFNLIRLAVLNQQLGLEQEEKQAWNEVQNSAYRTDAMQSINLFKIGNADLNKYIEKRQKR